MTYFEEQSQDQSAGVPAKSEPEPNLPLWRSHKIVHAWPIRAWYAEQTSTGEEARFIYLEDGPDGEHYPTLIEPAILFSRYQPVPGDYFVIYDDGYKSISPKKAFEEGYNRVNFAPAEFTRSCAAPPEQDLGQEA